MTTLDTEHEKNLAEVRELYLSTMVRILNNTIYEDGNMMPTRAGPYDPKRREVGRDWPEKAFTMIGVKRMNNLRQLAARAIAEGVPGDFIETGVWRGGACVMMRAVLQAYGDKKRTVFVADSFEGLPPSNAALYPSDAGKKWDKAHVPQLAVSVEEVAEAFKKFDLLDDQVKFLKGWFKDTLPGVKDRQFALIRLDGDMYESTIQALENLYPALSGGGFTIIDDYSLAPCKAAVEHYRKELNITAPLQPIDANAVWWQKPKT